jgi:prepilin-type N-terminal cleavage/methylation domain-containing protein
MSRQKSMENQKLNNRGFSLIELIVVITILVVLAGGVMSLTGLLNGRQAKQAREKLFSRIDGVRTTTMAKRNTTAILELKGTDYVMTVTSTTKENPGGDAMQYTIADSGKVELYYSTDDISRTKITSSITIEFDRASGALKAQGDGTYIRHIYAVQGSKEYGIKIYPETGKIQKED